MFRGEPKEQYRDGMNKMFRLREKLQFLRKIGVMNSEQERNARYAEDLLWHAMVGRGKRQEERDR